MKFQKCDFPLSGYETFGDQTGILKELGENYKNMTLEEIYDKLSQYFNEI